MRILYIIQAHRADRQILALLELIFAKGNSYIVATDPAIAFDETLITAFFEGRSHSRYHVRRSLPITWGGYSQVLAWIDLLDFAARFVPEWDIVINLSGECLPLASPERLAGLLRDVGAHGVQVAFNRFNPKPWMLGRDQFNDRCFVRVDWQTEKLSPFFAKARINDRVDAWVQPIIAPIFADPDRSPILNWFQRTSIHCTDTYAEKLLVVRGLFPHEIERRQKFLADVSYAGGRAWFVMWRSFVEMLLKDPEFFRIVSEFEHAICPDEIAFQTYVATMASRGVAKVWPENLHYKDGNPLNVDDGMAGKILDSDALFVRKVDYRQCPLLVAAAKKRVLLDR
ncbi:MAG TPA: beta-1,6-N-acetylglucosaminyltransferase [Stellaceae bacterium]|nr:beta-1,6-N-acetylglucosaminyltransferase [Stellaceae bacterium]